MAAPLQNNPAKHSATPRKDAGLVQALGMFSMIMLVVGGVIVIAALVLLIKPTGLFWRE